MEKTKNKLYRIKLPEDRQEMLEVVRNYLFGPIQNIDDGLDVISGNGQVECHTYAIIDAMKKSDISVLLDAYDTDWQCLWKGEAFEHFSFYAPYIVKVNSDSRFSEWLLDAGWGKDWGIYIRSYLDLDKLAHHFRKFNEIYDEANNTWVMFRFYSPKTIEEYVPHLPIKDFIQLTDGVVRIISESNEMKNILVL